MDCPTIKICGQYYDKNLWRVLRCSIALHGRDVYDHATTVVKFDPMTLAIIFPLLTTDISPNFINALIECLTTPFSLQTPARKR